MDSGLQGWPLRGAAAQPGQALLQLAESGLRGVDLPAEANRFGAQHGEPGDVGRRPAAEQPGGAVELGVQHLGGLAPHGGVEREAFGLRRAEGLGGLFVGLALLGSGQVELDVEVAFALDQVQPVVGAAAGQRDVAGLAGQRRPEHVRGDHGAALGFVDGAGVGVVDVPGGGVGQRQRLGDAPVQRHEQPALAVDAGHGPDVAF